VHAGCDTNLQVLTKPTARRQSLTDKEMRPYLPISTQIKFLQRVINYLVKLGMNKTF